MTAQDVQARASVDVPDAACAVVAATDDTVAAYIKTPDALRVALQDAQ